MHLFRMYDQRSAKKVSKVILRVIKYEIYVSLYNQRSVKKVSIVILRLSIYGIYVSVLIQKMEDGTG